MHDVLFTTIHGSRLYNLHHAGSDYDYFTVIANKPRVKSRFAKQTIVGEKDSLVCDFSTFVKYCEAGVPQYLESMFAPEECVEIDLISEFRKNYYINTPRMMVVYNRTIRNFLEANEFKRTRHAYRLMLNQAEGLRTGRMSPRLIAEQAAWCTQRAEARHGEAI